MAIKLWFLQKPEQQFVFLYIDSFNTQNKSEKEFNYEEFYDFLWLNSKTNRIC